MRWLLGAIEGRRLGSHGERFLRDDRRSPGAFPRRWTNPRRLRKQIRRGYQSYFFAPSN